MHLKFLRSSGAAFDSGQTDEAIRMAVSMRVLLHDTKASTSLLTHLKAKNIPLLSTSAYISPNAIVKYFVRNPVRKPNKNEPKVSMPYVVVSFLPTIVFVSLVVIMVGGYATNHGTDFEKTRTAIAGLEALFGVYIGYVLEDLFRYHRVKTATSRTTAKTKDSQ